jgi:hypothetical protein
MITPATGRVELNCRTRHQADCGSGSLRKPSRRLATSCARRRTGSSRDCAVWRAHEELTGCVL